jgi:hypothetical protein
MVVMFHRISSINLGLWAMEGKMSDKDARKWLKLEPNRLDIAADERLADFDHETRRVDRRLSHTKSTEFSMPSPKTR